MVKTRKKKGLLVVISGPSGVGKSTVVENLFKKMPELIMSISASTRPARTGEVGGVDYFFMTKSEFLMKEKKGEFLESAKVHGEYYGTPKKFINDSLLENKTVVVEVDTQGALSIKAALLKNQLKVGASVFIFLIPPSIDILAFRLKRRRTEKEEMLNKRLKNAMLELQAMEKYDYIVVNEEVEVAAEKLQAIIKVEKERMLLN